MVKERLGNPHVKLILIAIILILLSLLPMFSLWPKFFWSNEPVHSSIEAFGAFVAILIALIMWQRENDAGGKSLFLAAGFIGMGILDFFHAISLPGNAFVFLHSIALLSGGFFFALSWMSKYVAHASITKWISWVVLLFFVLLGVWAFVSPHTLPQMVLNGKFTDFAITTNLFAGIFFLTSAL